MSAGKSSMSGKLVQPSGEWLHHAGDVYRCEARLVPSGDGFVATAPAYSGLSASGMNEKEALSALRDKLAGEIRRRKAAGEALPSGEALPVESDATVKWLTVRL